MCPPGRLHWIPSVGTRAGVAKQGRLLQGLRVWAWLSLEGVLGWVRGQQGGVTWALSFWSCFSILAWSSVWWVDSVTVLRGSSATSEGAAPKAALGVPGALKGFTSICCTLSSTPGLTGPSAPPMPASGRGCPPPGASLREGPTCGRSAAPHASGSDLPGTCGRSGQPGLAAAHGCDELP